MKTPDFATLLPALVLALAATSCSTPNAGAAKVLKPGRLPENANLWRQVKSQPAAYVPRAWPGTTLAGPANGKWIVDARNATAYFVPNKPCGGLTPGVWEGEARKVTHRYTRGEEMRRNAATVMAWPARAALGTLLWTPVVAGYGVAMVAAGGGGVSGGSFSPAISGIGGSGTCSGAGGR